MHPSPRFVRVAPIAADGQASKGRDVRQETFKGLALTPKTASIELHHGT